MPFSHLQGNPQVKELFQKLLERGLIPQAMLFSGPKGVGKALFAQALARQLLRSAKSQHPDFHWVEPSGKSHIHTMEAIGQVLEEAGLPPFEAPVKVFILNEAERMLAPSSNALLKTLEEPPKNTHFILISHEPEKLLPTLVSRLIEVRFFPLPQEEKRDPRLALSVKELFQEGKFPEIAEGEEENLFEEIALYFRDNHPDQLRDILLELERSRLALERHVKLSTILLSLRLRAVECGASHRS
jgi:DNA polymerase-3 subunit delta'